MSFALGSDPELFLKRGTAYISAVGLIGGSKDSPRQLEDLGRGFAVQEDNVLLEYNTPPAKSVEKWVTNHSIMMKYLSDMLKEKGITLAIDASAIMPEEELQTPESLTFGCDPDYNAYTLRPNPRPFCENWRLRSAGGHVHVGTSGSKAKMVAIARAMDYYLGLYSVLHDSDTQRKELYGKAGAMRFKSYGLEYRVLSNFWLKRPTHMRQIWDGVNFAITNHNAKFFKKDFYEKVQQAINTNDKELARELRAVRIKDEPVEA